MWKHSTSILGVWVNHVIIYKNIILYYQNKNFKVCMVKTCVMKFGYIARCRVTRYTVQTTPVVERVLQKILSNFLESIESISKLSC
jgi:hypothetical protein